MQRMRVMLGVSCLQKAHREVIIRYETIYLLARIFSRQFS
jgi:hypothetical protein